MGSILRKHVGIENVMVSKFRLSGTILVHNLCFQKEVCVRYSKDYWTSHNEITADYVSTVSRDIDKFTFTLLLPDTLPPGARVEMCARLTVGGETFWDNNSSQNYQIECVPLPPSLTKSVPLPRPMITPISLNPVPSFADTKENIYYYWVDQLATWCRAGNIHDTSYDVKGMSTLLRRLIVVTFN